MSESNRSRPANPLRVEQGDLVIWYGSEWTVHEVVEGEALLRRHYDTSLSETTVKVAVTLLEPFVKAADR